MTDPSLFRHFVAPVRSALRAEGFSGSSSLFQRPSNDVVHLVQLQRSRYPAPATMKVTVNLAVWVNVLAPARAGHLDPPNEPGAYWRERIGFLMQPRRDHWWSFSDVVESQKAGTEASVLLITAAMPVFQSLPNALAVRDLWRTGASPGITEFQRLKYLERLEAALAPGA